MKKFSEMSYHELKTLRNLVIQKEKTPVPFKKEYTDYSLPKYYFIDAVTEKRKQMDFVRWIRDSYLTNDELMEKIQQQLSYEKMLRQLQQCEPAISGERLLRTKLFNN